MNHVLPDFLKEEYPYKPRTFVTPWGVKMSYLDEGSSADSKEAVLLLHGNPTWSFYYRKLIPKIFGKMRCIVPDHIGMGLSDKPLDYNYTLKTRIDDIELLVNSLGITKVHLVVHDWGGAIGMGWAVCHPNRVGKIVILNTAAFTSTVLSKRIAFCRIPVLGPWFIRALNGFAWPATWMAMAKHKMSAQVKAGYLLPYHSWDSRVAVNAFVQDIPMQPTSRSRKTLETIEAGLSQFKNHPVFIVWGGKDFCFNDYYYNQWKERYPHAQSLYLPDIGHYVLEDCDSTVLDRIAQFILT